MKEELWEERWRRCYCRDRSLFHWRSHLPSAFSLRRLHWMLTRIESRAWSIFDCDAPSWRNLLFNISPFLANILVIRLDRAAYDNVVVTSLGLIGYTSPRLWQKGAFIFMFAAHFSTTMSFTMNEFNAFLASHIKRKPNSLLKRRF